MQRDTRREDGHVKPPQLAVPGYCSPRGPMQLKRDGGPTEGTRMRSGRATRERVLATGKGSHGKSRDDES